MRRHLRLLIPLFAIAGIDSRALGVTQTEDFDDDTTASADDGERSATPDREAKPELGSSPEHFDIIGSWIQPLSKAARSASQTATSDYLLCCSFGSTFTIDGGFELTDHVGVGASETYMPGVGLFDPAVGFDFYGAIGSQIECDAFAYLDVPLTNESQASREATAVSLGATPILLLGDWKVQLDLIYAFGIFTRKGVETDAIREATEKEGAFGIAYSVTPSLSLTARASLAQLSLTQGPDLYVTQVAFPGIAYKWDQTTFSATYMATSLAAKKFLAPSLPFAQAGVAYSIH